MFIQNLYNNVSGNFPQKTDSKQYVFNKMDK